jgi:hypothetical protein
MTMNASPAITAARARLDAERERLSRPRVMPDPGVTWRATPTPVEANRMAAGQLTMQKIWDLSPIDPMAFDPTQPPGTIPDPPVNSSPPFITSLAGLEVGDQVVCSVAPVGPVTEAPPLRRLVRPQ